MVNNLTYKIFHRFFCGNVSNPRPFYENFPFAGVFSKTHPSSLTLKGGSTLSPKPPFPPGKGDVAGSRYSSRQFFLYRQQSFRPQGAADRCLRNRVAIFCRAGRLLVGFQFFMRRFCSFAPVGHGVGAVGSRGGCPGLCSWQGLQPCLLRIRVIIVRLLWRGGMDT